MNAYKIASTLLYLFMFLAFVRLIIAPEPWVFFVLFIAAPLAVGMWVVTLLKSGEPNKEEHVSGQWYEHF